MATGVLLVGLERATRLLGHLTLTEKAYDATVRLGAATTTDDAEGETLSTASVAHLTEDDVRSAAGAFIGVLEQKPSAVSAVKVDGRRAYARVRAGEDVDLPARTVTVHELLVTDVRPGAEAVDVDVSVRCSSGTYVRAIARDLGSALGVGGHLTMLRRTAVGPFTLADARDLDTLADEFRVVGMDDVVRRCFTTYDLSEEQARDVFMSILQGAETDELWAGVFFDQYGRFDENMLIANISELPFEKRKTVLDEGLNTLLSVQLFEVSQHLDQAGKVDVFRFISDQKASLEKATA